MALSEKSIFLAKLTWVAQKSWALASLTAAVGGFECKNNMKKCAAQGKILQKPEQIPCVMQELSNS